MVTWQQLIAVRPDLDVTPNYVGRRALMRTLKPGLSFGPKNAQHPVTWFWDGEHITTVDKDAYWDIWGDLKLADFTLCGTPAPDAAIEVKDNAWVLPTTVFVD